MSALEAVIGGAILSVGMIAALVLFNSSQKRARSVASAAALLPVKEALIGDALTNVWTGIDKAAKAVPAPGSTCTKNACNATFGAILPIDYVDYPEPWLAEDETGDFLTKQLPGNQTQSVGTVPSKVLQDSDPASHAVVDPAYCRATNFVDLATKTPKSHVFQVQTKNMTPGTAGYGSFYSFFNTLYRPYTPSPSSPPSFSPPAGSLPQPANSTYRFAIHPTTGAVMPQLFAGGDGWLTKDGANVQLPDHLGFYWSKAGGCAENPHSPTVCNTVTTPINLDFVSGEFGGIKLTDANAPTYRPDTLAAKALQRCQKQTFDNTNFGLNSEIYFCLVFQRSDGATFTPVLSTGITGAFGEFIFRVRDVKNNASLSCSALSTKIRKGQTDYYGELYYTFFWTDTTTPNNPRPKNASGTVTRMEIPQ